MSRTVDSPLRYGASARFETMPSNPIRRKMIKDCWAVTDQMLNELDRAPLGPADQLGQPSLTLDQRQLAKVFAVMLDQVEGVHAPRQDLVISDRWRGSDRTPFGSLWVHEIKHDGYRLMVGMVRAIRRFTRNGLSLGGPLPAMERVTEQSRSRR